MYCSSHFEPIFPAKIMKARLIFSIYVVRFLHLKSCYFTTLIISDKASKF